MPLSIPSSQVKVIYFACEAGMGSSLMSASWLRKRLGAAKLDIEVIPKPAVEVPYDAKVVVTNQSLVKVVRYRAPNAVVLSYHHFLNDPVFDHLLEALVEGKDIVSTEL